MSLELALAALRQAKRISGTRASYAKDNPAEWEAIQAYLDGGPKPTGNLTLMGQGLVEVEDKRRELAGVPSPSPSTGLRFALVSNGDMNASAITGQSLGAKVMRSYDRSLGASVSSIVSDALVFQSRGIEPYLLYAVGTDFATASPGNIAAHAAAVGPGGSQAHAIPVRWFELGNEMLYKYSPKPGPEFADEYTRGYLRCHAAIKAANPNVKVMFSIDTDAGGTAQYARIADLMYSVDPKIHEKVDAWVLHHYGPITSGHTAKLTGMLAAVKAKGAPDSIPVIISEDGIPTDNRQLTNGHGWPTNLTYDQAAVAIRKKVVDMRALLGSRLIVWSYWVARDIAASGVQGDGYYYMGAMKIDGTAKGAMTTAVRDLAAAHP